MEVEDKLGKFFTGARVWQIEIGERDVVLELFVDRSKIHAVTRILNDYQVDVSKIDWETRCLTVHIGKEDVLREVSLEELTLFRDILDDGSIADGTVT